MYIIWKMYQEIESFIKFISSDIINEQSLDELVKLFKEIKLDDQSQISYFKSIFPKDPTFFKFALNKEHPPSQVIDIIFLLISKSIITNYEFILQYFLGTNSPHRELTLELDKLAKEQYQCHPFFQFIYNVLQNSEIDEKNNIFTNAIKIIFGRDKDTKLNIDFVQKSFKFCHDHQLFATYFISHIRIDYNNIFEALREYCKYIPNDANFQLLFAGELRQLHQLVFSKVYDFPKPEQQGFQNISYYLEVFDLINTNYSPNTDHYRLRYDGLWLLFKP